MTAHRERGKSQGRQVSDFERVGYLGEFPDPVGLTTPSRRLFVTISVQTKGKFPVLFQPALCNSNNQ